MRAPRCFIGSMNVNDADARFNRRRTIECVTKKTMRRIDILARENICHVMTIYFYWSATI